MIDIASNPQPRIRQKTIVQQVMEQMKDFVASGALKPGDRLPTEIELAKSFGVSRSSIREALKIFSYLGVFDSQTKRGTILCDHSSISNEALTWTFLLGEKDFDDLIELRKAIEQEAWLMLCEIRAKDRAETQPIIDALKAEVLKMKKAVAERDIELLENARLQLPPAGHRRLQERAVQSSFSRTLKSFTLEEIRKSNIYRNMSKLIYTEHMQILKGPSRPAIRRKLLSLFRTHIRKTKKNVEAFVLCQEDGLTR